MRGVIEKRRTLRLVLTPLHPCPHFPVSQLSVIGLPRLLWLSLQIHPDEILPLPLALTPSCSEPLPPSFSKKDVVIVGLRFTFIIWKGIYPAALAADGSLSSNFLFLHY